jgi:hypothetical protein
LINIGRIAYGEARSLVIKGYNLSAWGLVRKSKDKGGLGVINIGV